MNPMVSLIKEATTDNLYHIGHIQKNEWIDADSFIDIWLLNTNKDRHVLKWLSKLQDSPDIKCCYSCSELGECTDPKSMDDS